MSEGSEQQPIRGDRRDGIYVSNDEIDLAISVALATGRPLLLRGNPGSGKSSLAMYQAKKRGWRYYEQTITSRTQARELLFEVDELARLQDARAGGSVTLRPIQTYIRPGFLWWAIDRQRAREFGSDPYLNVDSERAVVLLDEIDKADPDVPNNLLVPLGSFRFQIPELAEPIQLERRNPPLVIITSNGERELPQAFLRRCVEYFIPDADGSRLVAIARAHFPELGDAALKEILDAVVAARPVNWSGQALPSPAEFIDNINAVRGLPDQSAAAIAALVVWKSSQSNRIA